MLFNTDNKVIFYDGAMGTMLQKYGLKPGDMPDLLCITQPSAVLEVHKAYIEAGSDLICTNTFGANTFALRDTNYTPEEIISSAVSIAKQAVEETVVHDKNINNNINGRRKTLVVLDIGPIGLLLEPFGDLEVSEAKEMFARQAIAGEIAGADLVAIETMGDLNEMEAAITAVSENTKLPILATMTFDKNGRTYMGVAVEDFITLAEKTGVTAMGMNCSLEPKEMYQIAEKMANISHLPLIFKLNAGLPDGETGLYTVGPEEFARQMLPYLDLNMRIVGGCCGTSPEYIKELKKTLL